MNKQKIKRKIKGDPSVNKISLRNSLLRSIGIGLVFIVMMFLTNRILTYLTIDDSQSYTRIMMKEMYEQQNIDILFLGSSHCYLSLDPKIADEIFGANTFNAGSSSQALDGSYAMLQEVGAHHELKEVYLEVYYDIFGKPISDRTQLTDTYILSDYMRPSFRKIRYLLQAGGPEHYMNSFVPARRYWGSLLSFDTLRWVVENKKEQKAIGNTTM